MPKTDGDTGKTICETLCVPKFDAGVDVATNGVDGIPNDEDKNPVAVPILSDGLVGVPKFVDENPEAEGGMFAVPNNDDGTVEAENAPIYSDL